jgi:hypothetical protein
MYVGHTTAIVHFPYFFFYRVDTFELNLLPRLVYFLGGLVQHIFFRREVLFCHGARPFINLEGRCLTTARHRLGPNLYAHIVTGENRGLRCFNPFLGYSFHCVMSDIGEKAQEAWLGSLGRT